MAAAMALLTTNAAKASSFTSAPAIHPDEVRAALAGAWSGLSASCLDSLAEGRGDAATAADSDTDALLVRGRFARPLSLKAEPPSARVHAPKKPSCRSSSTSSSAAALPTSSATSASASSASFIAASTSPRARARLSSTPGVLMAGVALNLISRCSASTQPIRSSGCKFFDLNSKRVANTLAPSAGGCST